jgi:hypothetical protein
MSTALSRFDDLLSRLENARLEDEEIHSRPASLEQRAASHDSLMDLRAEMAQIRVEGESEPISISGLHDSRTRQGTLLR